MLQSQEGRVCARYNRSVSNPRFITASNPDIAYARHSDAAVQSTCGVFRNAALLDSDRPLGVLPDWVIPLLGIETPTRQVSLSVQSERHAANRRKSVSQKDADFVVLHHAEALKNILAVEPYKPLRWRLICDVPSVEKRALALGLKLVPKERARTHRDEFWIETLILRVHRPPKTKIAGTRRPIGWECGSGGPARAHSEKL
jgi:hypothetical protein